MVNKKYIKGKYYERKTRKILEEQGYYTIRSAASKGIFDVVGIKENSIKLIQCKAGNLNLSKEERLLILNLKVPKVVSKEVWFFLSHLKPKIILIDSSLLNDNKLL